MQWNTHFDWSAKDFHFVEIFAGAGNTARQWCGPYSAMRINNIPPAM